MTSDLVLYHTDGCHLCELAEDLLTREVIPGGVTFEKIDIASDDRLMEQYGIRIPVLRRVSDDAEIGWPFDAEQLRAWL